MEMNAALCVKTKRVLPLPVFRLPIKATDNSGGAERAVCFEMICYTAADLLHDLRSVRLRYLPRWHHYIGSRKCRRLQTYGAPRRQIRLSRFGRLKYRRSCASDACRQQMRRVELVISP